MLVDGELTLSIYDWHGMSAYEMAVQNGFIGTEEEWLASLKATVDTREAVRAAMSNGISNLYGGGLAVTPGDGLTVTVNRGGAVVEGYLYVQEEAVSLSIPAPAAADRIDRVIVRLTLLNEGWVALPALLQGVEAEQPQPPELTRSADAYELSLAQIRVQAGAAGIEASAVSDERADESVCGYAVPVRVSAMLAEKMDAQSGVELAAEVAGKASTAGYTATLLGAGWSTGVPHTQTVAVEGILATDNPFVDVDMSGATTGAAGTALSDAWTLVGRVEAGAGSITAYCYDDAPAVDIPLILKVVR